MGKMSLKGVKLKSESLFLVSPAVFGVMGGKPWVAWLGLRGKSFWKEPAWIGLRGESFWKDPAPSV